MNLLFCLYAHVVLSKLSSHTPVWNFKSMLVFFANLVTSSYLFFQPTNTISFVLSCVLLGLIKSKPNQKITKKTYHIFTVKSSLIFLSCSPPADLVVKALKAASWMCIRRIDLKEILLYLIVPHNWIH